MITLEQARDSILRALSPLPSENVALASAVGQGAAEEVLAPADLPPFDSAAVDGYAVRCQDLAGASVSHPIPLDCTGVVAAGDAPTFVLRPATCARIFTGAVLPAGADAVVMQEDVQARGSTAILCVHRPKPWEGIRLAGEDVRLGGRLIGRGDRLRAAHVGLLASAGRATISVHRRPRLFLLSTGNELLELGEPALPGRIYDSNRVLLTALAASEGIPVVDAVRVPDTLEMTMAEFARAAHLSDVVLTMGGVSVGDADLVKGALAALGGTVEQWRIAMKPGKPFGWGRLEGATWFGLPGNPVSAYVAWWLLVRPALRRLMGIQAPFGPRVPARLGEPMSNRGDRRHFLRVRFDEAGQVRLAGVQGSHIQSSLTRADALLDLPPETAWEAGREVMVELLMA